LTQEGKSNRKLEKLHSEELHDLYPAPNIIWVITLRMMRCAGHMAIVRKKGRAYKILVEKPESQEPN
jgi:hypothetical protein